MDIPTEQEEQYQKCRCNALYKYVLASGYELAHFMRRVMFASFSSWEMQSMRFAFANVKQKFALGTVCCVLVASYADKCEKKASV